jgi:hypothetical protein
MSFVLSAIGIASIDRLMIHPPSQDKAH